MLPCESAVKKDLFQWLFHRKIRQQIRLEPKTQK